eukprot:EG_transcript_2119
MPRLWLLLLFCRLLGPAVSQPIAIGMTGPLYQDIGNQTAAGLAFAFQEANDAGGVMGRNLSFIALDDGYDTTKAVANIRTLVEDEGVLLLAGVVGTEAVESAKSLILPRGVPLVGSTSGAPVLRTPFRPEFVNVRLSYADEMVSLAMYFAQYGMFRRVACLYQNDSFGVTGLASLQAALANAGMQLVATGTYQRGTINVEAAADAIAGAAAKAQAVVLVATQEAAMRFITLFFNDSRTDPECIATVMSVMWGNSYRTLLPPPLWSRVYFYFAAPLPGDPAWAIARHFSAAYTAAGHTPDPTAFLAYITGRLIVEVLRRTRTTNVSRALFLNEVYNDRLFVLDDLMVGMYSTNYSGCEQALCSCNSGLRNLFVARLDPATGTLGPSLGLRYSVLDCSVAVTTVRAPLLFGQLLPDWDVGWRRVAVEIGRGLAEAFAEANANGGADGRLFVLLQRNYSSSASQAMAELVDKYPLLALAGSVAPPTAHLPAPVPSFGIVDPEVAPIADAFAREDVHVRPAPALELMALAAWASLQCAAIHLRAPATTSGRALLGTLTQSVHSFQCRATSTAAYSAATDVLATTQSGCVIALGSADDVLGWYSLLPQYPALRLLTPSAPAMRLMALTPNASSLPQAPRLLFPTPIVDPWNATLPARDPSEAWKYGYVLGTAVVQAMTQSQYASQSYNVPAELLEAWYTKKVMTAGALTLGPYFGDNCTTSQTDCECNEGVRTLGVRSVASATVQSQYSTTTCHVEYTPLQEPPSSDVMTPAVVGSVVGFAGCVAVGLALYLRLTRRNHSAAPKDVNKPFCILFTDIQASTHLWATLPDIMASALSTHHALIRRVIADHRCYEVKTIGDSFMVAAHSPLQAVRLALAVQTSLHEYEWGTDAIDAVYRELLRTEEPGRVSRSCWNGLRVRVGIHYGLGDIQLDPVSQGYDYYGTVVNTAARIESVCHGGQIGVSQAVYDAVCHDLPEVVWED